MATVRVSLRRMIVDANLSQRNRVNGRAFAVMCGCWGPARCLSALVCPEVGPELVRTFASLGPRSPAQVGGLQAVDQRRNPASRTRMTWRPKQ